MTTTPLVALTPEEVAQLYAMHLAYCRDNPDQKDWQAHYERAQTFAKLLPDTPLELQVRVYEVVA